MSKLKSYDLLGYTYLSDGVWGYVHLCSGTKKEMEEESVGVVDGYQFTDCIVVLSDEDE